MGYPLSKLKWAKGRPTSATLGFLTGEEVLAIKAVAKGTFVPSSNTIFGSLSSKIIRSIPLASQRLSPMLCSLPATEQLN